MRAAADCQITIGVTIKNWQQLALAALQISNRSHHRGNETLAVTKDAKAPYGILVGGAPIALGNQATADKSVVLHLVNGNLMPPANMDQVGMCFVCVLCVLCVP